uniref:Uncharacterized protein n=1 Tax=Arundo donax TaxID=35708 RepID=A0A0A9C656_ARUDO
MQSRFFEISTTASTLVHHLSIF